MNIKIESKKVDKLLNKYDNSWGKVLTVLDREYQGKNIFIEIDDKTFVDPVNINGININGTVRFNRGCKFYGLQLYNIQSLKVEFTDCKFIGETVIKLSNNHKNINFYKCKFHGNFDLRTSDELVSAKTRIENCEFYKKSVFKLADFSNTVSLYGSVFLNYLPDMRKSDFSKGWLNFNEFRVAENSILKQFKSDYKSYKKQYIDLQMHIEEKVSDPLIAEIATDFKLKAAAQNDHLKEAGFFSIESRAKSYKSGFTSSFISELYFLISNYGRSIIRPFLALIILTIISVVFSTALFINNVLDRYMLESSFWSYTVLTIHKSLPIGFGITAQSIKDAYILFNPVGTPPVSYQIFYWVQSILSFVMWFLLLLGVRNRFKLN